MDRREFLQRRSPVARHTAVTASRWRSAAAAGANWPIGCFNRPWTTWSFDETLKQITAAGYQTTGLLRRRKTSRSSALTPRRYLARLKQRIAGSGLKANRARCGRGTTSR